MGDSLGGAPKENEQGTGNLLTPLTLQKGWKKLPNESYQQPLPCSADRTYRPHSVSAAIISIDNDQLFKSDFFFNIMGTLTSWRAETSHLNSEQFKKERERTRRHLSSTMLHEKEQFAGSSSELQTAPQFTVFHNYNLGMQLFLFLRVCRHQHLKWRFWPHGKSATRCLSELRSAPHHLLREVFALLATKCSVEFSTQVLTLCILSLVLGRQRRVES